jgi:hypothetical protein
MKKVLMILTKDRRDCVEMNLRLHELGGSFEVFDHVVFLLNKVTRHHMRFIDAWIERHPWVACDKIIGDGTRPKGISDMQNRCIEKYPESFYAKTDEDVFVQPGWAGMMWEAYETHRDRDDLALITPLVPNNAYGLYILCHYFYPDLLDAHRHRFQCDPEPHRDSFTWHSPYVAEWATRTFIRLAEANEKHYKRLHTELQKLKLKENNPQFGSKMPPSPSLQSSIVGFQFPYHLFSIPFSIGCIGYDYRHWKKMGGIPWNDEPGWCKWVEDHGQTHVLDCRQIVLHYTFFVQQEWLDRSTLIEDIRSANLPDTVTLADRLQIHRLNRIARQLPAIFRRRILKRAI